MTSHTRKARDGDVQALQALWKTTFGDTDEQIEAFFMSYFDPEMTAVVDFGDCVASAGYVIPVGSLVCDGQSAPCAMVYAVATDARYQKRGFGSAVVRRLVSLGRSAGYDAIVLSPSEDSLFEFYSRKTGFRDCFYVAERIVFPSRASGHAEPAGPNAGDAASHCPAPVLPIRLAPATPSEYARLAGRLAAGIPRIVFDEHAISYQALLCRQYGGGLFCSDAPGIAVCAAVERQEDGSLMIKEMLYDGIDEEELISSIAALFPANEYLVRTPALQGVGVTGVRRFGMLAACEGLFDDAIPNSSRLPYFGFAFD